jgi:hypothetical protein
MRRAAKDNGYERDEHAKTHAELATPARGEDEDKDGGELSRHSVSTTAFGLRLHRAP